MEERDALSDDGDDGVCATQAPAGYGLATQMPSTAPTFCLVAGADSYPGIAELRVSSTDEVRLGRLGDAPLGPNHADVVTISRHQVTLKWSDDGALAVHHVSAAPAAYTFVYEPVPGW